jgi:hypothetical protein
MSQVVRLHNNSYKPITNTVWVRARLCKLQKRCTRLAAARDNVYQLLIHGRWFSPGTPASSTTKTGRHDIAEILLKVAINAINQSLNQITFQPFDYERTWWMLSQKRVMHTKWDILISSFLLQLNECILHKSFFQREAVFK